MINNQVKMFFDIFLIYKLKVFYGNNEFDKVINFYVIIVKLFK